MEFIKPTIFLAFADSRKDLPELVKERRALEDMLTPTFNVLTRDALTHTRMNQFLREEGHRLRIFHFGGHANETQLAFLSESGKDAAAYVKGVAGLIGKHKGVELVFLNGCSTQGQVDTYLKEKLPAVIATSAPVSDPVAQEFANLFYANFVARDGIIPLQEAFEQAKSQLDERYETYRDLYSRSLSLEEEKKFANHFPYELYLRNDRDGLLCYKDLLKRKKGEDPEKMPPYAHLLINRDDENEEFRDKVKGRLKQKKGRTPVIYLVQGEAQELPLKLCERFRRATLQESFKKSKKVWVDSQVLMKRIEMPRRKHYAKKHRAMDVLKEGLVEELELEVADGGEIREFEGAQLLPQLNKHLQIVYLQHNLYAGDWDPDHSPKVMKEYLGKFWKVVLPENCPDIVLVLGLKYPKRKGWLNRNKKPDDSIPQAFEGLAKVLELLQPVEKDDVEKWKDKYASDDPGLTDRIFKKDKPIPMETILPLLEAEVRARRR